MTERTVLALDLSSARGVIAVTRGQEVLFETSFQSERSHNAQVFPPLREALAIIGKQKAVIAFGTGPGSYTGVRISIAAVQGIALSRGWPVVGLPSIATIHLPHYHVLGDARRGSFYTATVSDGQLIVPPTLQTAELALAEISKGGKWITLDTKAPSISMDLECYQPEAQQLGRIVGQWSDEEVNSKSTDQLEPIYLQEAFVTIAKKVGKTVPIETNMHRKELSERRS